MLDRRTWGVVAAVVLALAGCGGYSPETGVKVTGKILKGNQPIKVKGKEVGIGRVEVILTPVQLVDASSKQDGAAGKYDDNTGAVEFVWAGKGVQPGKYMVLVKAIENEQDLYAGKYAEKTTFLFDIPKDKVGGTFDIGTVELDSMK